jgi:pantothenate kinase
MHDLEIISHSRVTKIPMPMYLVASLLSCCTLNEVDGKTVPLRISSAELEGVIIPLCCWLREVTVSHNATPSHHRTLIGIIGPAGSGKSTLSQLLAHTCNALWDEDWATTLRYQRLYLTHFIDRR